MQRNMEVAATGILEIMAATHRENAQVTGTETNTMISVFYRPFQKMGSFARVT